MSLRARLSGLLKPRPPAIVPPAIGMSCHITRLMADQAGFFVRGWAHAFERPVESIAIEVGGVRVPVARLLPTPYLLDFYPEYPHLARVGFALHVPSAPEPPLRLIVVTAEGEAVRDLASDASMAARSSVYEYAPRDVFDAFGMFANHPNRGAVLELRYGPDHPARARFLAQLPPGLAVTELRLGDPIATETPDAASHATPLGLDCYGGIFSLGVLDRVAEPWRLIADMQSALTFQGAVFHLVGGGAWQMSRDGLGRMFGPSALYNTAALGDAFEGEHWVLARKR